MTISIQDSQSPLNSYHPRYNVTIFNNQITTVVTSFPAIVNNWISQTVSLNQAQLIVGLDIEWLPSFDPKVKNPVAVLQLCVGNRCLVFQIIHAPKLGLPQSLYDFLSNPNFTFVGVGIQDDVEKLVLEYNLRVANAVDLRYLAAEKLGRSELMFIGLKRLTKEVLGKDIDKPKSVTLSKWDSVRLTSDQIQYACVDAFLSFEIGRTLMAIGQCSFYYYPTNFVMPAPVMHYYPTVPSSPSCNAYFNLPSCNAYFNLPSADQFGG